jgi:hypothetical protein
MLVFVAPYASVAWVVREATEHYIPDKWPLFPKPDQKD